MAGPTWAGRQATLTRPGSSSSELPPAATKDWSSVDGLAGRLTGRPRCLSSCVTCTRAAAACWVLRKQGGGGWERGDGRACPGARCARGIMQTSYLSPVDLHGIHAAHVYMNTPVCVNRNIGGTLWLNPRHLLRRKCLLVCFIGGHSHGRDASTLHVSGRLRRSAVSPVTLQNIHEFAECHS